MSSKDSNDNGVGTDGQSPEAAKRTDQQQAAHGKQRVLTEEMREVTRKIHTISDHLVNLKLLVALTKGELYGRALLLFYYIYAQIELSLEAQQDHPLFRDMKDTLVQFKRAGAIEKDLVFYLGKDWNTKYSPSKAVQEYVSRLKTLEKDDPVLLLPYFYHMYLAVLAGGNIIKKLVKRSLAPPDGEGLHTFEFEVKSRMSLKNALKDKVNALALDDDTKQRILQESIQVFRRNNQASTNHSAPSQSTTLNLKSTLRFIQVVNSLEGSTSRFIEWTLKWIVVFTLIYLEGEPPREEYPPPGPQYGDRRPYGGGRSPPHSSYDPDYRGRRRSESRDGGYDMGRNNGRGRRSRSRSPPGYGGPRQNGPPGQWRQPDDAGKERSKAVQAIEPMDTYKVFMMRQDENSTPETYQQRYEEYKKKYVQRVMRAFFEDHKREEWLQERYSPAINYRLEQQKKSKQLTEAKNFGERVRSGTAKICFDEENGLTGKDFDNDMEDSSRILYIRRIPCACPATALSESIKKAGGNFQSLYLSDPVKKCAFDFDRSAYIVYESPEAAAEALPRIHNTFVQDADTFTPFRLQVSQHRSRAPLKTPSYLSVASRITHDYNQALSLAVALDKSIFSKESDLNACGIEALLQNDAVAAIYSTEKQKLDVIIAYLRRVHHYIYYAGTQCIDMGDIMHAHPALFCRPEATPRDLEEEKAKLEGTEATEDAESKNVGGWAAALDEKVQAYLKELDVEVVSEKREKQKALVDEIESREEAALESTYANFAEKAGEDGKHRCRLCTKLFKAMDFVKKHIRNKHPELAVDKIAEVGESYMWEQYREDPERPLPPIESTNQLINPTLGGRGNGNGSPYQNRGGNRGSYDGGRGGGRYNRDGPPGYRGRGPPPRDGRPRRGSFGGRSPPRSPRHRDRPEGDMPVDPRRITTSYQDLDNLQDTKVELAFDALDSLPPPKKKAKM
ncbi:TPA: hypothetical protein N0F65_010008 [Lagenidium giganteum]|uniref:C2H2-type domain-containing protein n=1 Tax=Lagenidium giganteum TaxID=4803 RepID=A0AAV2ZGM6_9STRA|nr:TPA: hypothetical protein N0F65_010008 [Lagenidium giganteum]